MADALEIRLRHYEETVKLYFKLWQQRNAYYFGFVLVASVAAIYTHRREGVENILAQYLSKIFDLNVEAIRTSLPFWVIYFFLSFCVIFVLALLCHRAEMLYKYRSYISRLESDIRGQAAIPISEAAFSIFRIPSQGYYGFFSWIFGLLLLVPVAFLVIGGFLSHFPAAAPRFVWDPLQLMVGVGGWLRQHAEFCMDTIVIAMISVLLSGYFTRRLRHGPR